MCWSSKVLLHIGFLILKLSVAEGRPDISLSQQLKLLEANLFPTMEMLILVGPDAVSLSGN